MFIMNYFIVIGLLSLSAIFSGLTLGFFSLDKGDLKRKAKLGDKQAIKVYQIRKNGNQLLATLIFSNVVVNSVLSVFLGSITSGVVAVILATLLIVVFGEVLPQAIFSRHALAFGARFAWFVKILIFVFYPLAKPIDFFLDKVLGKEMLSLYSRDELVKLIEDHENSDISDLGIEEGRIMKGALLFADKAVEEVMTPRIAVFSLKDEDIINDKVLAEIKKSGRSRIPVTGESMDDIVGILYVKDLVGNNFNGKSVGELARKNIVFVNKDRWLDSVLKLFAKTKSHLFIVQGEFNDFVGIITIEDIIEEIIGMEIVDEFDKHEDMREAAKSGNI